ncbi:MAG: cation:proton antiporter [Ignavibacteriales bacterium]|nr:MAG: cation:proton antiporter [Ignavibacteriales bacterium]
MKLETKSKLIVFVLSFLVWIALTSAWDIQEVLAGLVLSFVVSSLAGSFLITTVKKRKFLPRILAFIKYLFVFMWEMIKANFHVAYIVLHPMLPIKPGIVKIKTSLTKDSALTILADSITLTPGTMSVDINPEAGEIYIHWIDIVSKNPEDVDENTKNISVVFEKILMEVFE